jgi:hypothetical protein
MISKERFEQLVIHTCKDLGMPSSYSSYFSNFAHALIKAVEDESEVVAWGIESEEQFFFGKKDKRPFAKAWKPYLALPLVEESK